MTEAVMVAVPAAKGTVEISKKVYERSRMVMERQLVTFDHEKVFWSSIWSVGLVGLLYGGIKLGQVIRTMQEATISAVEWITDPLGKLDREKYEFLYDWVDPEGEHYEDDIPTVTAGWWKLLGLAFIPSYVVEQQNYARARHYRDNPDEWATLKAKYEEQYGPVSEGEHPLAADNILDTLDDFFSRWGPLMPVAAISFHSFAEYLRVKKMEKETGTRITKFESLPGLFVPAAVTFSLVMAQPAGGIELFPEPPPVEPPWEYPEYPPTPDPGHVETYRSFEIWGQRWGVHGGMRYWAYHPGTKNILAGSESENISHVRSVIDSFYGEESPVQPPVEPPVEPWFEIPFDIIDQRGNLMLVFYREAEMYGVIDPVLKRNFGTYTDLVDARRVFESKYK